MLKNLQYFFYSRLILIYVFLFFSANNLFAQSHVSIDTDSLHQIIRGFGAANIVGWRPDMTEPEIEKAFGTGENQIGFSLLRVRVPYDENQFNVNLTTTKLAYSMGVSIIGSPWSPPPSLKTNNNIVKGRLSESSYAEYAAHLKSYVDYMAENDAPLYAISVQNEPDVDVTYESCDWTASELTKFIGENGADVGARLIAPESYHFDKTISDTILTDSAAAANVSIVGGHLYGGGLERYRLAEEKGKEIWMTEYLTTDTNWASTLSVCEQINTCLRYNMSAYLWWYIVRFYGPIDENSNITKRGYAMSQFARFIRPGYVRIQATQESEMPAWGSVSAFKSDSSLVVVMINNRSESKEVEFAIDDEDFTSFTPYVTSKVKDCERGADGEITGNVFSYTLEDSSITTFVLGSKPTDVEENLTEVEKTFSLSQNYPNPFNPTTTIEFSLSALSNISLVVYDNLGQEVNRIINKKDYAAGIHQVYFDAGGLPSGIYFYQLKAGSSVITKKFVLLK